MPVSYTRRNRLWRLVEDATGRLVRNDAGTPVDGGGHASEAQARRQAGAINSRTASQQMRRMGQPARDTGPMPPRASTLSVRG